MSAKFDATVLAELNALYDAGMTGVGQQYESLIELAIKRTNLRDAQVKVSLVKHMGLCMHTYCTGTIHACNVLSCLKSIMVRGWLKQEKITHQWK